MTVRRAGPGGASRDAPALLLDVRETSEQRGFHVMAAAALMAPGLAGCRLFALTSGHPDEAIAIDAFRFDTALAVTLWDPAAAAAPERPRRPRWAAAMRRLLVRADAPAFHVYAAIVDEWPADPASSAARAAARRTLLGLTCGPLRPGPAGTTVVDGNDTPAFAAAALAMLGPRSGQRGR